MGYLVALTRGGSPSVDLMVATPNGKKTVTIQVKTRKQGSFRSRETRQRLELASFSQGQRPLRRVGLLCVC